MFRKYIGKDRLLSNLFVVVVSVLVITTFILVAPIDILNRPCGDCKTWYYPVAENLLAGKGLITTGGRPALDRPPGHVMVLAAVIATGRTLGLPRQVSVYIFNVLMLSLSAAMLFSIAERYFTRISASVVAGLWVSSPFVLWFTNQPYTEVPFFFLLFSSVLCFLSAVERDRLSISLLTLSGLSLAISILIRPIGIGLVLVFIVTYWLTQRAHLVRERLIVTLIMLLCVFVVVGPWIGFVYHHKKLLNPLSDKLHTAGSLVEGVTFGVRQKGYRQGITLAPDVREFMEDIENIVFDYDSLPNGVLLYGPGGDYDVTIPWNIIRIVVNRLSNKPKLAGKILLLKVRRSWYGTDSNRYETLALSLQLVYFSLILPALYFGWRRKQGRLLIAMVVGITFYLWIMATIFMPLVRYLIPALGLLFTCVPAILEGKYRRSAIGLLKRQQDR